MAIEPILDELVRPRPNGSEALQEAAAFITQAIEATTATVAVEEFSATPFGFALLSLGLFLLTLAGTVALLRRRYLVSLALFVLVPVTTYLELDRLWSAVSGLVTVPGKNIIATFEGPENGHLVVLSAHYDSATQIGDHVDWQYAAIASTVGLALALVVVTIGLVRKRPLPKSLLLSIAPLVVVPPLVGVVQQTIGPLIRAPSPGALDNAGSVAVLLELAERLGIGIERPHATVVLAFLAGEEERALGSRHFAEGLRHRHPTAVVNLETVGASGALAYAEREGFLVRHYPPSPSVLHLLNQTAESLGWPPLRPMRLPGVMYTDGRSFLAAGLPAITLLSYSEGGPRGLHSLGDDRSRLSTDALQQAVTFLEAFVRRVGAE